MSLKNGFDFKARLEKVRALLKEKRVEGVLIEAPVDLLYLTGIPLSAGKLIIGSKKDVLLVDGRYLEACQSTWQGHVELFSKESFRTALKPFKKIGFDSTQTSVEACHKLKEVIPADLVEIPEGLKTVRACKDAEEIEILSQAAQLNSKGFKKIVSLLKEGVTEEELALAYHLFCLQSGAKALAFDPIIAFGENSAMPHYRPGKRKLKKGDIVLIDIGVKVKNYCSDMTRVVPFGKLPSRLLEIEQVVYKAHAAALKLCKPGVKVKALDTAARKEMKKAGCEELFVHTLGHGVGLEIHEYPRLSSTGENKEVVLEKGMVITIEPGLYIPGLGGVRHEDTIVITSSGYKNFYPAHHA